MFIIKSIISYHVYAERYITSNIPYDRTCIPI